MTAEMPFESLCKYVKISAPQKRKFYCEIKFFIYEITSRLLRDKFFYLVVEFFLLRRGFFLASRELRLVSREFRFLPPELRLLP